jgi:hypothetical protein
MRKGGGHTVLFTTLAMNQTLFFEALGAALEARGVAAAYLTFHERSHAYLEERGRRSFNAFAPPAAARSGSIDWGALGIANPAFLLSHEKAAFELADTARLLDKLAGYAMAAEAALDRLLAEGRRPTVVQELGGFTSILAAFHAARARGIDNWFLEPSFFRGRVLLVRNSLAAKAIAGPTGRSPSAEVSAYLDHTLLEQAAIVPRKDQHHYRAPWRKIADGRHLRRLLEKLADKYVLGLREEFSHIAGHTWRHARMAGKSLLITRHYRGIGEARPFVYYPLHVPADVALTLRSPAYLDQCALVDYLCRVTPAPYRVAIKEHPALVGAIDYPRLRTLFRLRDNLVLLDARLNNYAVLKEASAVVTVNSKSGAEALLLGRPVLVLGDAFYRESALVTAVARLEDLEPLLRAALGAPRSLGRSEVLSYFQDLWEETFAGELYVTDAANVARFADALADAMAGTACAGRAPLP